MDSTTKPAKGFLAIPPAHLAELRRLAYKFADHDLARVYAEHGLPSDLVPIRVAAQFAHVTLTYVQKQVRSGKIPAWKVGNRVLIPLTRLITRA